MDGDMDGWRGRCKGKEMDEWVEGRMDGWGAGQSNCHP